MARTVRVVIVTALSLEFVAVRARLAECSKTRHPHGSIYASGKFVSGAVTFEVLIVESGQGNSAAADETSRALDFWSADLALFVGVAGGIKDVSIGDVVAADEVYNLESGKARTMFEPRPHSKSCSYSLIQIAKSIARDEAWQKRVSPTTGPTPKAFTGSIVSGEKVVASLQADAYGLIRSSYGHCLAVEMEAFGFLTAAQARRRVEVIVIRGISDLIEGKSEADSSGSQPNAVANACAFAFELLAEYGNGLEGVGSGDAMPGTDPSGRSDAPDHEPAAPAGGQVADHAGSLPTNEMIWKALVQASATVLNWPTTLTGNQRIVPPAEAELMNLIANGESSTTLVLGVKGVGKSALLASVGLRAKESGHAVLAIRADRIPADLGSTDRLAAEFLQLPVSIDEAIAALAATSKVAVLIDQLDSVSELTDRKSNRLNMLINLIQRLSGQKNVHIIASSREFDFRHDSRLNSLNADSIRLEPPNWEIVGPVLAKAGRDPDRIGGAAREMLCIPWNLNLYLRLPHSGEIAHSEQGLLESIWRQFVAPSDSVSGRVELLERIARRMSDDEELFVPSSLADDLPIARDALLHDDILSEDKLGLKLAFRHQTFFDHTLARLFAAGKKSLAEHVLANQDGLFVRPAMLRGLELLRPTAPAHYEQEVRRLLAAKPRTHIRALLIEFIAQRPDPTQFEAGILLPLLAEEEGAMILRAASGSAGWFDRFRADSAFVSWLQAEPERASLCVSMLIAALPFDSESVRGLLDAHWFPDPKYDQLVVTVASYLKNWDDAWASLVCDVARRSDIDVLYLANAVAETSPTLAGRMLRAQLDREFERTDSRTEARPETLAASDEDDGYPRAKSERDKAFGELITSSERGRYALIEFAEVAPQELVEQIWPWFERVLQNCWQLQKRPALYIDVYPPLLTYRDELYPVVGALHSAMSRLASDKPGSFLAFSSKAVQSEYLASHIALVQGYIELAKSSPKAVIDYLTSDRRRLAIGTFEDEQQYTVALIRAVVPHLDADGRERLVNAILDFDMYQGAYAEAEPEHRRELKKYSRSYRLRLLQAFPVGTLSQESESLRLSEESQLAHYRVDRSRPSSGFVGARMTAEELGLASDENVLKVIDEVRERENKGRQYLRDFGIGRSGGTREQAMAFGELAEKQHERVLALLRDMIPEKHEAYVAAAIVGLSKSSLETQRLVDAIKKLDQRGFASDEFRESAASAVEKRCSPQELVPRELAPLLEGWLTGITKPTSDEKVDIGDRDRETRGESIIFSSGPMYALTHGRGSVTRALTAIYGRCKPVDITSLVELIESRSASETSLRVLAELMWHATAAFADRPRATEAYDLLIRRNPEILTHYPAMYAMAAVCGFVRPEARFEEWLQLLSEEERWNSRQVYGELLFLQAARTDSLTAKRQISIELTRGQTHVVRGLAFGGAAGWLEPHCRQVATDILCNVASLDDVGIVNALNRVFMPSEDRLPVDIHTKRLIRAVLSHPETLAKVAGNLMESVAPFAGEHPEIVSDVCTAVLRCMGTKLTTAGPHREVAAPMTSAVLTLHRQSNFREIGLELFEELITLGVHDAAAALELIDRSPIARSAIPRLNRPRRRRLRRVS